jgi:hypothetical protein
VLNKSIVLYFYVRVWALDLFAHGLWNAVHPSRADEMQLLDVFSIYKSNNEFDEWLIILFLFAV